MSGDECGGALPALSVSLAYNSLEYFADFIAIARKALAPPGEIAALGW